MLKYCEDCGSIIGVHGCTWCNEELYILDQYNELIGTDYEMELPDEDSNFMKKVREIEDL